MLKAQVQRQLVFVAAAVLVGALTNCSAPASDDAATNTLTASPSNSIDAIVDDEGFALTLADVTVTAPAGVAPVGTPVRIARVPGRLPGGWSEFATSLADGVDIRLGDGRQPQAPVTISFGGLNVAADVFVLSDSADGEPELLDQPPSSALQVTTGHLSSFWPIMVNVSSLAQSVFRSATDALQMTSPQPDCFIENGRHSDLDMRISEVPDDLVWPCLQRSERGGITLSLQSNTSVAWRVRTSPAWEAAPPIALTAANILALSAWRAASPNAADEVMLLPGGTATYDTAAAPATTSVGMLVDPVMSQVRTLALGLGLVLPEEAIDGIGRAECLPDLLTSGVVEKEPTATGFAAIFRCFGAATGGGGGRLVSLLAAAPAALWGQLEGALRSATRHDEVTFTVENTNENAAGSGEPIDRAKVEAWLGDWVGPIDQPGSPQYSVRMNLTHNGRTIIGAVEYPELSCRGTLDGASLARDRLSIEETITDNGDCVTNVDLELTMRPGEIIYHFDARGGGDGVLRRP